MDHKFKRSLAVLAAGHSRRFNGNKLLYKMPDGRSLIEHTLDSICQCHTEIVVVVQKTDSQLQKLLNAKEINWIANEKVQQGMSYSIALAISHSFDSDACGIMLADMPFILPSTISRLAAHATSNNIVRPQLQQQVGHPVFFGQQFYRELRQLQGDNGAQNIIDKHKSQLELVDVEDAGVIQDIDTPSDLGQ